MPPNYIRIPMFKLYHLDSVNDFNGFDAVEWAQVAEEYSEEEVSGIVSAIGWAVKNREFDFLSLLPNLKFSNEEIYSFFCKLDRSLPR